MLKFIKSVSCALSGIVSALKTERHMQIHLIAVVLVIAAGVYRAVSVIEWCLLLICCGMVVAAELFNTALEAIVDLVSPEYHMLAKRAKDCAAGAVLVLASVSVAVAFFIFVIS